MKLSKIKNLKNFHFKNNDEFKTFNMLSELFHLTYKTFNIQKENPLQSKDVDIMKFEENEKLSEEPEINYFKCKVDDSDPDHILSNDYETDFDLYIRLNKFKNFNESFQNYISKVIC